MAASEEASYSTRCRRTRPGHTQCYRPHPELISSATTVVRKIDSWVLMPTPQAHHAGHGQRQVAKGDKQRKLRADDRCASHGLQPEPVEQLLEDQGKQSTQSHRYGI